jgi:hypothetical protein
MRESGERFLLSNVFGNLRSGRLGTNNHSSHGFQVSLLSYDTDSVIYLLRYSARLLQLSLPLVETYGFSREALARSVLCLGTNSGQSPTQLKGRMPSR